MKGLLKTSVIVMFIASFILAICLVSWFVLISDSRYLAAKHEANSVGLTPFVKASPFEIFINQKTSSSNRYVFRHDTEPHALLFDHIDGTNDLRLMLGNEWSLSFTYVVHTNHIEVLTTSLTTPDVICIDTNMDCIWDIRHKWNCLLEEKNESPAENIHDEPTAP